MQVPARPCFVFLSFIYSMKVTLGTARHKVPSTLGQTLDSSSCQPWGGSYPLAPTDHALGVIPASVFFPRKPGPKGSPRTTMWPPGALFSESCRPVAYHPTAPVPLAPLWVYIRTVPGQCGHVRVSGRSHLTLLVWDPEVFPRGLNSAQRDAIPPTPEHRPLFNVTLQLLCETAPAARTWAGLTARSAVTTRWLVDKAVRTPGWEGRRPSRQSVQTGQMSAGAGAAQERMIQAVDTQNPGQIKQWLIQRQA